MIALISLAMTFGSIAARVDGDTKAEQLLAQARQALGGEKNLAKVQGLACTGTYERTMGDRQLSGELTIDLQPPDKMLRTETMKPMGDMTVNVGQGINGEKLLRSQRTVNGPPGAVIRMGTAPAGGAPGAADSNGRPAKTATGVAPLPPAPAPASAALPFRRRGAADSGHA